MGEGLISGWIVKAFGRSRNKAAEGQSAGSRTSSPTQPARSAWCDGRPSIFSLIEKAAIERGTERTTLEIEEVARYVEGSGGKMRWAPGAIENIVGSADESKLQTSARVIVTAIGKAVRQPSQANDAHLYDLLCSRETISTIDEVIERLNQEISGHRQSLAALALRLVHEAPDLEPLKTGIALLGISGTLSDAEAVLCVGRHEELTNYSVIALLRLLEQPEPAIWSLAKQVFGWGRIVAVRRLAANNPCVEVRQWMLREGFRNDIMDEYLAATCATVGDLSGALRAEDPDPELLIGAADMLRAMSNPGPTDGIKDYPDGASACVLFLQHMVRQPVKSVHALDAAVEIRKIEDRAIGTELRDEHRWSAETFLQIRTLAHAVLLNPVAREVVDQALRATSDILTFNVAANLAPAFGIDAWNLRFVRQEQNRESNQWYWLMQSDNPARIGRVTGLARSQLDLTAIGSGPTTELFAFLHGDDGAFDFILHGLKRFPGLSWYLVEIGLRGRGIRSRNSALHVLETWGTENWPADAFGVLQKAAGREPDEKLRQRILSLIAHAESQSR